VTVATVNLVLVDVDNVDPSHLEELAALIRWRQYERIAHLAELADRAALGAYRQDHRPPAYPADAPPLACLSPKGSGPCRKRTRE
jgi:hypothetical protein